MASLGILDLKGGSPVTSPGKPVTELSQQPAQSRETAKVRRLLEREIHALTHKRLKEVVLTALRGSPSVVDVFQNLLLVPEGDVVVEGGESEDGDDGGENRDGLNESKDTAVSSSRAIPSHKRRLSAYTDIPTQPHQKKPSTAEDLVARYATCKNCEQEFDATKNFSEACNYHDGDLEVNFESSTWDDWNEDTWGPIDERLEEDFPEGFKWDCCEGDGNARGCQTDWHQK